MPEYFNSNATARAFVVVRMLLIESDPFGRDSQLTDLLQILDQYMFNSTAQKKKILIVDDDGRVRELLTELLGNTYECTSTSSPIEALGMASDGIFSLVITDVEMPELSGIELCRRIRETLPSTAVVVVSGNSDEMIRAEALAAGAAAFVPKPFDLFDLEASVKSSLSRSEFRSSAAGVSRLNFAIALDS